MTRKRPPVTLLTDFDDFYVAAMRGVVASITDAPVHDIFHRVPPQDVRAGAFILRNVAPYYPGGTVHCVVVDPGVGTERRSLVVEAGDQYLVGPDNGVLVPTARVLAGENGEDEPRFYDAPYDAPYDEPKSHTFHGRDVFAPQAARVAADGIDAVAGERVEPVTLDLGAPTFDETEDGYEARAEIVYVDRFGNTVTNLSGDEVLRVKEYGATLRVNGRDLPFERTYAAVSKGEPLALVGSHGNLEIAAREASGAEALDLSAGDEVVVVADREDTKKS
ncbi:MAG: SAM-dependent chlorinase/fluorinase [Halobacteriales archaeon]|nr:SAM-dependent chlorinase/fluorinase [Halobacteriales archaeon]